MFIYIYVKVVSADIFYLDGFKNAIHSKKLIWIITVIPVVSGGLRGVPTDIAAPGCHSRRVGSDIACESCDPGLSFQPHLNYKPLNGGVWDPKIN